MGNSPLSIFHFSLGLKMPTVFASVSITILLFYVATLGMAYTPLFSMGAHILLGLFTATLIILLQCLIFGFFIGSGKSMKQKVQEYGLSQDWIQKTKDYKNRSYPALMLAILVSAAAAILGGGVSSGAMPVGFHHALVWAALLLNVRSLWISYKVVVENVNAIHRLNGEIQALKEAGWVPSAAKPKKEEGVPVPPVRANAGANYYFLAMAVWVPYLYMKWSLGSRTFPFWPFLALSGLLLLSGWLKSLKNPRV